MYLLPAAASWSALHHPPARHILAFYWASWAVGIRTLNCNLEFLYSFCHHARVSFVPPKVRTASYGSASRNDGDCALGMRCTANNEADLDLSDRALSNRT